MSLATRRVATIAAIVVAVIAIVAALFAARTFFIPLALALTLAALCRPLVRLLARRRVPAPVSAVLCVVAMVATVAIAGVSLGPPLRDLARRLPQAVSAARTRIRALGRPLERMIGGAARSDTSRAHAGAPPDTTHAREAAGPDTTHAREPAAPDTRHAREAAGPDTTHARAASSSKPTGSPSPIPASVVGRVFGQLASTLSDVVSVVLLLLFVLAAGDAWHEKLAAAVHTDGARQTALDTARELETVVARYITVTAAINLGQAIVIALATWWLGLPTPLLWGVLTFIAEFIPYFGGLAMMILLAVGGLAGSQDVGHALLAPGIYLAVTTLQNNFVSPLAYGRGLELNPAAILVGVMFWYFVWGIPGAFLAVPLLAGLKVVADHIPALAPLALFLGREPND